MAAPSIPRLLHFIWINRGGSGWGWEQAMSLGSALANTGYDVMLHTDIKPSDSVAYSPYDVSSERLTVIPTEFPERIHGVKMRPANISDWYRIKMLHEHGGLYSDLDILWFREVDFGVPTTTGRPMRLCCAYENPSYKTVANAFIAAVPGHPALAELLGLIDEKLARVAACSVDDLTWEPETGISKYHTLLWKLTGDHIKKHADLLFGRQQFYKNGWRRIGRQLRSSGVALGPRVDEKLLGATEDRFQLGGEAVGYHWYATLYPLADQMRCPVISSWLIHTVVAASKFWGRPAQT